eukprot:695160-Prymnesium_polylepis.1
MPRALPMWRASAAASFVSCARTSRTTPRRAPIARSGSGARTTRARTRGTLHAHMPSPARDDARKGCSVAPHRHQPL